jgi:hypothetical protein
MLVLLPELNEVGYFEGKTRQGCMQQYIDRVPEIIPRIKFRKDKAIQLSEKISTPRERLRRGGWEWAKAHIACSSSVVIALEGAIRQRESARLCNYCLLSSSDCEH